MSLLKENGHCDRTLTFATRPENRYSSDKTIYNELVDINRRLDKHLIEKPAQADYHRLPNSPDLATEPKVCEWLAE